MKRGRKSQKELDAARERMSVVSFLPGERPAPLAELTEAQAETWKAVVSEKPWDWFSKSSWPVLASYCRAVDACAKLAKAIDKLLEGSKPADLAKAAPLLSAQEKQVRIILATATKMRLTHQSVYRADAAAAQAKATSTQQPQAVRKHPWAQK